MAVEFYLIASGGDALKLPVNPPEAQITAAIRTVGFTSIEEGEFTFGRGRVPARFSFESFFPGVGRQPPEGSEPNPLWPDWRHPLEYVAIIGQWMDPRNKIPLQLLITDSEVTGWDCFIESFDRRDPTGGHGDVWYTLTLIERREMRLYTQAELVAAQQAAAAGDAVTAAVVQRTEIARPDTYVTREGDTFWEIAKRFYDDGDKWADIWQSNLEDTGADPNPPITPGTTLRLP
jgi:hypothetical protein